MQLTCIHTYHIVESALLKQELPLIHIFILFLRFYILFVGGSLFYIILSGGYCIVGSQSSASRRGTVGAILKGVQYRTYKPGTKAGVKEGCI